MNEIEIFNKANRVAWLPPDSPISLEQFGSRLVGAIALREMLQFAIGDMVVYGEQQYGAGIWQYLDGRDEKTVRNYISLSRAVPPHVRMEFVNDDYLSYSHFREVQKLRGNDEKQIQWLAKASREGWSSRQLGRAIKEDSSPHPEVGVTEDDDSYLREERAGSEDSPVGTRRNEAFMAWLDAAIAGSGSHGKEILLIVKSKYKETHNAA